MGLFGSGCSPSTPPARPSNPLPDCPNTPNCERASVSFDVPADALYSAVLRAMDTLHPTEMTSSPEARRASAVYRVALMFKDDLQIAVEPDGNESVLHIRSASRVGQSDLGVNARRVNRLLRAVRERL